MTTRLLEFLSLWFDQTILANCVTAMLIFLGPIFWQKESKTTKGLEPLTFGLPVRHATSIPQRISF